MTDEFNKLPTKLLCEPTDYLTDSVNDCFSKSQNKWMAIYLAGWLTDWMYLAWLTDWVSD